MDRHPTDSINKILSKLIIPPTSHNNHYSSNSHSNTNRPSKSHSLYNVKDFLPEQEPSNPVPLPKRMETQPFFENSRIFYMRTVTDHAEESNFKEKLHISSQHQQEIKSRDARVDLLEQEIKKLNEEKKEAIIIKRNLQIESKKQSDKNSILTQEVEALNSQMSKLKETFQATQTQLSEINQKQSKRRKQIKFWSMKMHLNIEPRNRQFYSVQSQTDFPKVISNVHHMMNTYYNSEKTSQLSSQWVTQNNNLLPNQLQSYENTQIPTFRRTPDPELANEQANYSNLKSRFMINLRQQLFKPSNKENEGKRSNLNKIPNERKVRREKAHPQSIQIYPVHEKDIQSIIKALMD